MTFSVLSDQFLIFQTVFLFLQLEQPMAATSSHFLRTFLPFQVISRCYSSLVLCLSVVSQDVSSFQVPSCTSKNDSCTSQGCFTGLVPRLIVPKLPGIFSVTFSVSISADFFLCSVIFPSNQVCFLAAHITSLQDSLSSQPYPECMQAMALLT